MTEIANSPEFDPYAIALEDIDPAQDELFEADAHWGFFERLRKEDPVHYTADSAYGPYWSLTRYKDICEVDTDQDTFTSTKGVQMLRKRGDAGATPERTEEEKWEWEKEKYSEQREEMGYVSMFIALDPPKHDLQRATALSTESGHVELAVVNPMHSPRRAAAPTASAPTACATCSGA